MGLKSEGKIDIHSVSGIAVNRGRGAIRQAGQHFDKDAFPSGENTFFANCIEKNCRTLTANSI
jgi:hypothetical protein